MLKFVFYEFFSQLFTFGWQWKREDLYGYDGDQLVTLCFIEKVTFVDDLSEDNPHKFFFYNKTGFF